MMMMLRGLPSDDKWAGDWLASHDAVHGVFVNKKPNAMLMPVISTTEVSFVAVMGLRLSMVLPCYCT